MRRLSDSKFESINCINGKIGSRDIRARQQLIK